MIFFILALSLGQYKSAFKHLSNLTLQHPQVLSEFTSRLDLACYTAIVIILKDDLKDLKNSVNLPTNPLDLLAYHPEDSQIRQEGKPLHRAYQEESVQPGPFCSPLDARLPRVRSLPCKVFDYLEEFDRV